MSTLIHEFRGQAEQVRLLSERILVVVTRNSTYRFTIGRSCTDVVALEGGEVLEGLGTNAMLPPAVYAAWGVQGLARDIGPSTRMLVDALVGKRLTLRVSTGSWSDTGTQITTSPVLAAYWTA